MARVNPQKVQVASGEFIEESITVAVGSPVVRVIPAIPVSIFCWPGSGGSLKVEIQLIPGGRWALWPFDNAFEPVATSYLGHCNAMKFTATGATGVVELAV